MDKEEILTEIISSQSLPDHEAVGVMWASLTKTVDMTKGEGDHKLNRLRPGSLVEKFSDVEMRRLLKNVSVDSLAFFDPPLETILTDPEGTPDEDSTMRAIGKLRSSRDSDPKDALMNLVRVLERIYTHEFKDRSISYVTEILSLTRKVLYLFCILAVSKLP
ncbi:ATPase [Candidatus Scalindua japonica]|uniref:ATPase n=1 Tax=Candidatus Scalindua japonica TaxID=1284222 RepID=A0A286TYP8_9BACT|nr:hypothetical protein [Candidatus Scalindua japonica]GAX60994.1 ATPase [Candidatus Scalindua japonica]